MVKDYWKERAIKRRLDNKALSKRLRELEDSRNIWKTKYTSTKQKNIALYGELISIKKKLIDIVKK